MDQALKTDDNLKATELRLGLPGTESEEIHTPLSAPRFNKRPLDFSRVEASTKSAHPKAQIVGWPPIRSQRKSSLSSVKESIDSSGHFIKVSMDGAPFLRKIDLKLFSGYAELLKAIENMFKLTIGEHSEGEGYKGFEYSPTYEDKDGDLMLVGDVPWEMFMSSCKKLRIMKGVDARGLSCAT